VKGTAKYAQLQVGGRFAGNLEAAKLAEAAAEAQSAYHSYVNAQKGKRTGAADSDEDSAGVGGWSGINVPIEHKQIDCEICKPTKIFDVRKQKQRKTQRKPAQDTEMIDVIDIDTMTEPLPCGPPKGKSKYSLTEFEKMDVNTFIANVNNGALDKLDGDLKKLLDEKAQDKLWDAWEDPCRDNEIEMLTANPRSLVNLSLFNKHERDNIVMDTGNSSYHVFNDKKWFPFGTTEIPGGLTFGTAKSGVNTTAHEKGIAYARAIDVDGNEKIVQLKGSVFNPEYPVNLGCVDTLLFKTNGQPTEHNIDFKAGTLTLFEGDSEREFTLPMQRTHGLPMMRWQPLTADDVARVLGQMNKQTGD